MMQFIVIITGILVLSFIYVRRYQIVTYGYSPLQIFSHPKKPRIHLPENEDTKQHEVTVEELLPNPETIDPKNIAKGEMLIRKADIFLDRGDTKTAERQLIQATIADPSSQEAHSKLALLYLKEGRYGKAETMYRKLVISGFKEPSYLSNLGLALFQQQKFAEAKVYYQKAIEIDAGRAGRFFSLAQTLYELAEFEEAIVHFRKAIELEPKNLDYLLSLSHLYVEREMKEEAQKLLQEILVVFPECEGARAMMKKLQKAS